MHPVHVPPPNFTRLNPWGHTVGTGISLTLLTPDGKFFTPHLQSQGPMAHGTVFDCEGPLPAVSA